MNGTELLVVSELADTQKLMHEVGREAELIELMAAQQSEIDKEAAEKLDDRYWELTEKIDALEREEKRLRSERTPSEESRKRLGNLQAQLPGMNLEWRRLGVAVKRAHLAVASLDDLEPLRAGSVVTADNHAWFVDMLRKAKSLDS